MRTVCGAVPSLPRLEGRSGVYHPRVTNIPSPGNLPGIDRAGASQSYQRLQSTGILEAERDMKAIDRLHGVRIVGALVLAVDGARPDDDGPAGPRRTEGPGPRSSRASGADDALRLGRRPGARGAGLSGGHRLRRRLAPVRQSHQHRPGPGTRQRRKRAAPLPSVGRQEHPRVRRAARAAARPEQHLLLRRLETRAIRSSCSRRAARSPTSPTTSCR